MTESRFRERRSAYRDESEPEPEASAAPPSPSVADAEPVMPADSPERLESTGRAESTAGLVAERGEPADRMDDAGEVAGMDLDRLAEMEVPEPSFLELVEPHVEMALRFLGELPLTPDGERRILPLWAKREIDLLGLLELRTRGNLPPPEQQYLEQALDHLRTLYLKVNK
jgi:hypothetical protein